MSSSTRSTFDAVAPMRALIWSPPRVYRSRHGEPNGSTETQSWARSEKPMSLPPMVSHPNAHLPSPFLGDVSPERTPCLAGARHRGVHPGLERGRVAARACSKRRDATARTPTCSSSTTGRPTTPPRSRAPAAPRSSPSPRTTGCGTASPRATGRPPTRGYAYCGRLDADGQHPPAELRRMLEMVRDDECDVAVGSRFLDGRRRVHSRRPSASSAPRCYGC